MSDASGLPAGDPYDWFVRSRDLHAEGSAAAAAELLAHAVEQEPQARSLREAWARALFDARRYDDASREFLTLTEQAPRRPLRALRRGPRAVAAAALL